MKYIYFELHNGIIKNANILQIKPHTLPNGTFNYHHISKIDKTIDQYWIDLEKFDLDTIDELHFIKKAISELKSSIRNQTINNFLR